MKSIVVKLIVLLGAPIVIIKSASGQNSQPLPEFNKIMVNDDVQVELVIADRYSIYIEDGPSAEFPVKVNNQTIILSHDHSMGRKIKLFAKNIESIRVNDAAALESLDTIKTSNLTVKVDGRGKAKLVVNATNLILDADGASVLYISGTTATASMRIDGAANIKGEELVCQQLTIEADGAAKARVQALQTLNAKADGASSIRFKGDPQNRNFSIDGLASIKGAKEGEDYNGIAGGIREEITEEIEKELHNDGDTTRVKIGKRKLMIIEDKHKEKAHGEEGKKDRQRKMKSVWGGFELGVQGFATPSINFNMPVSHKFLESSIGKSWFFALNTPDLDAHIIKNKLALTTGLGIVWNNIHLDGNDYLTPNADSLTATSPAAGTNLSLNKLYTFDITAPLLIKFAPGSHKKAKGGFHIAAGAIIHYVVTSTVVTETSSGGYDNRVEMDDDFNINAFRVDGTVRMGYDRIKFFANYSLTPYFNSSKSPDVRLFSAGITLIGF
ncbi:MAG: head GIN domain-containing protein [Bacteroidota bacterium]